MSARVVSSVVSLAAAAVLCTPVAPATAGDPPFVGWSQAMPALAFNYDRTSSDACVAGRVSCVRTVVRQMRARFDPLARRCDHDAVFALAYLRTTEVYLRSTQIDGYFDRPALVNHEDVAFARMYFQAYDNWTSGRLRLVPPAWRVALEAADNSRVSGTGDLLLGMNAHINRDLPFVLAATGLVGRDGVSRKRDHDKINVMLNQVVEPLIAEEAARFDPQMSNLSTPYGVGYTGLLQMVVAWRETAWRQAERLVAAPDAASRRRVARQIEDYAEANAAAIVIGSAYLPPVTTTRARDRYCAINGNPEN